MPVSPPRIEVPNSPANNVNLRTADERADGSLPVINGTPTLAEQPFTPSRRDSIQRTNSHVEPQRLSFGSIDKGALVEDTQEQPVEFVRRSTRRHQPRKLYDASSGKYTSPLVVPDDA